MGDLTNELDEGEQIVDFCPTGPKFYSFLTNLGRSVVHMKGFGLNKGNARCNLKFDVI